MKNLINHKYIASFCLFGLLIGTSGAFANTENHQGLVGTIQIKPLSSDQTLVVSLESGEDLCDAPGTQASARLSGSALGYSAAVRTLLAAKLAGKQVTILADNNTGGANAGDYCVVKQVHLP